jgi:hypothetical protein
MLAAEAVLAFAVLATLTLAKVRRRARVARTGDDAGSSTEDQPLPNG